MKPKEENQEKSDEEIRLTATGSISTYVLGAEIHRGQGNAKIRGLISSQIDASNEAKDLLNASGIFPGKGSGLGFSLFWRAFGYG